jgi:uncharacterized membrane protein
MIVLALGVVLFAAAHLIPAVPPLKAALRAQVGARAYGMAFSAISLLTLILIAAGWRMADTVVVYDPLSWGWIANFVLTFIAFQFLAIFLFRGRARQALRFPLALAVIFWATGHLLANGDWASIILFGGLLTHAGLHAALGLYFGARPSPDVRSGHDMLAMLAGLALFAMMAQLHGVLIGVPVLTLVK